MKKDSLDIKPIVWTGSAVELIDQTKLPDSFETITLTDSKQVISAIKNLKVRGAPAIGIAGACAVALAAQKLQKEIYGRKSDDSSHSPKHLAVFRQRIASISSQIRRSRPTAINLEWAVTRMVSVIHQSDSINAAVLDLNNEAFQIIEEDISANLSLSHHGSALIKKNSAVLTHCNAGALATAGHGTALGIIKSAWAAGKNISVFITETRPVLQGARLTSWELSQTDIPYTLIIDSAAASLMYSGNISCVVVGADRISANGDVANKIGTYGLAIAAKANNIPFYVAAPLSTIDLSISSGKNIPIEQRPITEITSLLGYNSVLTGLTVKNMAFDITPNHLVSAVITERGIVRQPYKLNFEKVVKS